MTIKSKLDARIQAWALLKHPFYQAWEAGELPLEALQAYAREYGAFIRLMPVGWKTLGDAETEQEEIEHIELWQDFASGLGTQIADAELPAVKDLVASTEEAFAAKASALGALYAFEAQQPETAKSKLEGLKAHYDLPQKVEPYFEEHSHNEHEAVKLIKQLSGLSEDEQTRAMDACERMSKALWDALTDIHDTYCVN